MRYCVIVQVSKRPSDFTDDLIYLQGHYWCYYPEGVPEGEFKMREIKAPPFSLGEILILDKDGRELAPVPGNRKPSKWGAVNDPTIPKSYQGIIFELFNNFGDSLKRSLEVRGRYEVRAL